MEFLRRRRAGRVNDQLLSQLDRELREKFTSTADGLPFIHRQTARDVIKREHVRELFKVLPWYQEDLRTALWQQMRLILCILITMPWTDWENFQNYFFDRVGTHWQPRFKDEHLPIKSRQFAAHAAPEFKNRFLRHQYCFVPIVIEQNSYSEYCADYRLPIVKRTLKAEGGQGVVEKVTVKECFFLDTRKEPCPRPTVMACKSFTAKSAASKIDFDTERRVLEQFRDCTDENDRIMQSLASFVYGHHFCILSPWAEGCNLLEFLTKPHAALKDYTERSSRFTPHHLLTEAYNLAEALKFLHFGMCSKEGKQLRCAHLDLKPDNVLVCLSPGDPASEFPVGRWKISDFGLSKVEEVVTVGKITPLDEEDQTASLAPGNIASERSVHPQARGPGQFQPPEVVSSEPIKVTTRRDVWSYGCILAMVLAFALGGPEAVKEQERRRSAVGNDDFFYLRTTHRSAPPTFDLRASARPVDAEVKKPIREWLQQAPSTRGTLHAKWIESVSTLILTLLDVDVTTRPEIEVAVVGLKATTDHTEYWATQRLWDFNDSNLLFETPQVVVPSLTDGSPVEESSSPSPGARNHSSASSTSNAAIRRQAQRRDPQPSSGGSLFSNADPSQTFAQLRTLDRNIGAFLEPFGHGAAVWSSNELRLYNLTLLHDDPTFWSEGSRSARTDTDATWIQSIVFPNSLPCKKAQLAGGFLAVWEQSSPSSCRIRLFSRPDPTSQYGEHATIRFDQVDQVPEDFKLSGRGTIALKYRDRIRMRTLSGFADVPLRKTFAGMAFSLAGEYFCLWERDDRGQQPAYNYWTIWSQQTGATEPLRLLRPTIRLPLPEYNPDGAKGQLVLAPFASYPRFVACDRLQDVHIITADGDKPGAVHLGKTDGVKAGFVLPNVEDFLLVRESSLGGQSVGKCSLSYKSHRLQEHRYGKLNKSTSVDMKLDGATVMQCESIGGVLCLLVLKPSGLLIRKALL